ncbi:MAG: hypothetical protein QOE66_2533, partial [Chloroflexota bacterium]|nr:hypothetical protein [Chloroflexota bacterium]
MTEDEQTDPASGAADATDADRQEEGAVPGDLARARQHIVELEDRLERLARRRAALADLAERRREQLEAIKARNRDVQAQLANLRRRPGVRAAERASRAARAIQGGGETTTRELLGRVGVTRPGWHQLRATVAAEAAFIDEVRRALPGPPARSSLRVGVVIVGSPPDGPSSEGLRSSLARQSAAITEIRSADPLEASLADTVAGLPGDVILIVSAGLEPVEDTWLDRLLESMRVSGAAIVGARIVHGRRPGPRTGPASEAADLTMRHDGIWFEPGGGMPSPRLIDWGTKPAAVPSRAVEVPAVDSCLLVDRAPIDAIGGLAATQSVDEMDVVLCLRVLARWG